MSTEIHDDSGESFLTVSHILWYFLLVQQHLHSGVCFASSHFAACMLSCSGTYRLVRPKDLKEGTRFDGHYLDILFPPHV